MAWKRKDKPEYGNPFYNRISNGGYSTCCAGYFRTLKDVDNNPNKWYAKIYGVPEWSGMSAPGYTALPNCVGLANGAFNETYVRNKQLEDKSYSGRQYYSFTGDPSSFKGVAEKHGLWMEVDCERPPLGGIAVYPGHVAYIADVINNDTILILEDGYGGWRNSGDSNKSSNDPVWPGLCTCKRSSSTTSPNDWKCKGVTGKCQGFVRNPAIDPNDISDDVTPLVKIRTVSISAPQSTVADDGGTVALSIAFSPADYTAKITSTTWASSDTNVLTVRDGIVTGVSGAAGKSAKVTVTVTSEGTEYTASYRLTVVNNPDVPDSISISNVTIDPKQKYVLSVSVQPSTADILSKILWTSSNTTVATVDTNGVVTGLRGGKSTITAITNVTNSSGSSKTLKASCEVTVTARNGVYIKGKFYTPYIFHNGKWRRASANIGKNKKWKNSIEDISKNS